MALYYASYNMAQNESYDAKGQTLAEDAEILLK